MAARVRDAVRPLRTHRRVMKLLVAIHDVTPAYAEEVRTLHLMCAARKITPALLVVPNWHGRWPLDRHPEFVDWVKARARDGADILLHGERHDEAGIRRRITDEVRAWGRTAREAEFLTLDARHARERIHRGLEVLDRVGLRAIGFVPPAWLWRAEARDEVPSAGLRLSEDDRAIYLHERGGLLEAPVVRWSARGAWRAHMSAFVARVRVATMQRHAVIRIALHPGDLAHPATIRSLALTIDAVMEHGTRWRYGFL